MAYETNENEMDDDFFDLTNAEPPKDVFAFNEMRSCADLKRMCDNKQLDISPDFQREQVWKSPEKAKFLDSLLKNLPIPSMCFGLDTDNNKRTVIDGLQRISTVVYFLAAARGETLFGNVQDFKIPELSDIDRRLSGKTASQIYEETPEVIEAIENATIPVTVLRYSSSKTLHNQYIFTIFHRLNTGGTKLTPQEIRNGIFGGNFNILLRQAANTYQDELTFLLKKKNSHFIFEEFLLRFFAFQEQSQEYQAPLPNFLNDYMFNQKTLDEDEFQRKQQKLAQSFLIVKKIMAYEQYSKVVAEAILHGIGKNMDFLLNQDSDFILQRIQSMLQNPSFHEEQLKASTAFKTDVAKTRFRVASEAFAE